MHPDALAQNARMSFIMLEVFGTGGGNFRRLMLAFSARPRIISGDPISRLRFEPILSRVISGRN